MTRRTLSAAAMLVVAAAAVIQYICLTAVAASEPARPPLRLAETGLYAAGQTGTIATGVRPFSPQYPLWTDGLTKRRWIRLPEGAVIEALDADQWVFPVGTTLWKEFSLGGRPVETRMLWRASADGWVAATYVWNEDGTEALLAPEEGIPAVVEVASGRRHSIPARSDCAACHSGSFEPLGFNALQLSPDRDPFAIHGEPLGAGMITLRDLMDEGLLRGAPDEWRTRPPRIRTVSADTRAVLGYLVANCGSCHNGRGEISAAAPVLTWRELLEDGDAVARRLIGQPTRWQVPGVEEGGSVLVRPGHPDGSALLVRMRSRAPSSQMPPLGTVVRDQEAVDAITRWIRSEVASAH
jgi:hypothetical protein